MNGIKKTLLLLVLFSSVSVFPQKRMKKIVKKTDNSVFSIITYDKAGNVLEKGCGFFIDTSGRGISKAHIFLKAHSAKIILDDERKMKVKKLISLDPISNLALFKVKKTKKGFSYFSDHYVNPKTNEEVLVIKNAEKKD